MASPTFQPGLIMVLVGTYLTSLSLGFSMGYPLASWDFWNNKGLEAKGLFYATLPLGAILGIILAYTSNKYFGRNKSIISGAAVAVASFIVLSLGDAIYGDWIPFVGVLLMGVTCGIISNTAPSYLHECSHHERRGKLVAGHYAAIGVGQSLTMVAGQYCTINVFWTAACLLPFVVGAILLTMAPLSPTWLAENNRGEDQVKRSLQLLHGSSAYADEQLDYLKQKPRVQSFSLNVMAVRSPAVYKPLGVSVGLMLTQQATGINGILANFSMLGIGDNEKRAALAFALSHLIASLVAPLLVDRYGRKKMMQLSGALQILGLTILGSGWGGKATGILNAHTQGIVASVGLCLYVIGYSVGHGPVPWVMVNELLPSKAKVFTTTASTSSNWLFNTIITKIFTAMFNYFGSTITLIVFAVFVILGMIFVKFILPETAGLSVQDLEDLLRKLYDDVFHHHEQNNESDLVQARTWTKDGIAGETMNEHPDDRVQH